MKDTRRLIMVSVVIAVMGGCGGGSNDSVPPPPPATSRITAISGDAQLLPQHTTVPLPLTVRVLDSSGKPVAGVTVEFSAALGSAYVKPAAMVSDNDGSATWKGYIHEAGQQKVQASAAGYQPVSFSLDVRASGNTFDGEYRFTYESVGSPGLKSGVGMTLAGETITTLGVPTPPQPGAFSESSGNIGFVHRVGIDTRNFVRGRLMMEPGGRVTGTGTVEEVWMGNSRGTVWTWSAERL